jgi:hypothetical protein
MVVGVQLMVVGLSLVPAAELAPAYTAVYFLVGLCIFGPAGKYPSLGQAAAFIVPGILLVGLWALDTGFWCGLWLLGLPAWGVICLRWKNYTRQQRTTASLLFLPLLAGASAIFVVTSFFFNPAAFLMPLVPLVRLVKPDYRSRWLQALAEVLLSLAVVAVAVFQPAPEGAWSSPYNYAGGAVSAGLLMAWWANRYQRTGHDPRLGSGRGAANDHHPSGVL